MILRDMLFKARVVLRDTAVRRITEAELVMALNEGKNELVKITSQAREDLYWTQTIGTISTTTVPNPSVLTLPADFSQLKLIEVTTPGYEDTEFLWLNRSEPAFRNALNDGVYSGGFYYDIVDTNSLLLAPGSSVQMAVIIQYISTVPDAVHLLDTFTKIPAEHHNWIVTWAICEGMRTLQDERLQTFLEKLAEQTKTVIEMVNTRQINEPEFVMGFMEEEGF